MKLTLPQRSTLRMKFGGRCAYCGVLLPEKGWHIDHIEPVSRCYSYGSGGMRVIKRLDNPQNDRADNLWPCCRLCNINKSSMPLETWRKFLAEGPQSLASYNGRFRHMLRFGIVKVNPEPFQFWFEKYSPQ